MKVLWLCPIMLPDFAEYYDEKRNPKGGWITGSFVGLKDKIEIELCCPAKYCNSWDKKETNNTVIYTWKRTEDLSSVFTEILLSSKPDIIQIWGTEKKMTLDMVKAAESLGIIEKVLIICQGFVSLESRYHFYCNLPSEVINSESPVEFKYNISLKNQRDTMAKQGEYEIEALKKVKHIVGRTEWDKACIMQINPQINYYRCLESLRDSFYENKWDYDKCEKYSIFVSQSHYPVKGFHLMLEAMPLILKKYPNAKLYTTGKRPKIPQTFIEKCSELAYPSYVAKLIQDNHLENNVEYLGFLSEKKMCERYMKSNVAVLTSSIEDTSNSIGEAMLLGMPIVSANVGGISDFIKHKENGYLYQSDAPYLLAHYICDVFQDTENAIKIGENARNNALINLDRKTNDNRMLEIYREVISRAN